MTTSSAAGHASLVSWEYWHNTWPQGVVLLSRGNSADGYPNPLTPLTQDLVLRFEDQGAYDFVHQVLRVPPSEPRRPYFLALWGFVLVDADLHAELGAAMPGNSKRATLQRYMALKPDPDLAERDSRRSQLRRAPARAAVIARMIREGRRAQGRIDAQITSIRAARPATQSGQVTLDESDCLDWLRRLDEIHAASWTTLMIGAGIAGTAFRLSTTLLDRIVRRTADPTITAGDLPNRLHVAIGGNESAEMAVAVRRLAQIALQNPAVSDALTRRATPAQVCQLDAEFAAQFDATLARFGFHTTPELELAQPTWRQDPAQLLVVIAREANQPSERIDAADTRTAAEAQLRGLGGPLSRGLVGISVRASRHMMGVRENSKIPAVLVFDEIRRVLEIAGPLLVDRGVLENAADVVYLRYDELCAVLQQKSGPAAETVAQRKLDLINCSLVILPDLLEAGPGWIGLPSEGSIRSRGMLPPEIAGEHDTVFCGVAGAPGIFTGTVRVLADPWADFEAGEVLVARTVDPGWAATLSLAGAIVLDLGGPMSHGAMVARELGVPCVVGTRVTSARLTSGMTVTVDGSTGEVRTA